MSIQPTIHCFYGLMCPMSIEINSKNMLMSVHLNILQYTNTSKFNVQ